MSERPILVRGAKQLLTLRGPNGMRRGAALGDLSVIEDGSVLIRNGVIEQIGSTRRLENLKASREAAELDATGLVVMPGLVDSWIRLPLKLSGGPKRKRTADFMESSVSLLRACLQHGTLHGQVTIGAAGAASHVSVSLLREFARSDKLPFRPSVAWCVDEPAPASRGGRGTELSVQLTRVYRSGLAQAVAVAPACDPVLRDQVWMAAAAQKIPVVLVWPGGTEENLTQALRRARPRAIFCPCVLRKVENSFLASTGLPLICSAAGSLAEDPQSVAPSAWIKAGAPLVLASGFGEDDWAVFNMQAVISLAVLKLGLTIEQAISAATVNAAWSLGIGLQTGTLDTGKNADILLLQIDDYREFPRYFGGNLVRVAMRAGKIVFKA